MVSRAKDTKSLNCPLYLMLYVEVVCTGDGVWDRRGDVLYQVNCLSHCYKGCLLSGEMCSDVVCVCWDFFFKVC